MTKGFSRAITWVASAATALSMVTPALAWQQLPRSMVYEFQSQSGAVEGDAHVVRADQGDTVAMSVTVINRSQNPAGQVWYGTSALIDEAAPYEHGHEISVGTLSPMDGTPAFLDTSSFVNAPNNNRFARYDGAPVFPGQSMTISWNVKIASGAADGTYDMHFGLLREFDEWGMQWKNGAMLGSSDMFTRFIIGSGSTSGSGDLEGGAGDVTVTGLSTYANEEVGQDGEDIEVAAFEVEADDESDVEITSMKVEFFQSDTDSSQDLTDYATEVSIWMGGEEVGRADADDFSESSDVWSKSISLDDAIVRMGDTEQFVIAISAISNLDSGDIDDDNWFVGVPTLRFIDAEGVTTTVTTDADYDLDENGVDATSGDDEIEEAFSFASFGAAEDVELVFALNDDDQAINEAHVIDVDTADSTDDVEILSFTIEAEGSSDVNISELHSLITVTEATNGDFDGAGDIITNVTLWQGDDELASDTLAGAAEAEVAVFEDLDIDIEAGETEEFMIKVDLVGTDGVLGDGDTVMADFDATRVNLTEAKDETGEDLTTSPDQLTGTADGEASTVYAAGIMVDFVSASATRTFTADSTGENDQGTYKITFDVTAFDGDFYIDDDSEVGAATATGTYTLANAATVVGETYTATINGTAVVYTATATDDDGTDAQDTALILAGLAAAIDANATVGPLVNAVVTANTITLTATTAGTVGNYTTVAGDTSTLGTLVATGVAMTGGAGAANAAGQGVEFSQFSTTGSLPSMVSDLLESTSSDVNDNGNVFQVEEGDTRRFTLTVIYAADTEPNPGSTYVQLDSINWGTATDDTNANYYNFNLGDFKTKSLFLNGIA